VPLGCTDLPETRSPAGSSRSRQRIQIRIQVAPMFLGVMVTSPAGEGFDEGAHLPREHAVRCRRFVVRRDGQRQRLSAYQRAGTASRTGVESLPGEDDTHL